MGHNMIGKTYGCWTIENLIDDSSGNGVVWHATNPAGEKGAIKILRGFDIPSRAEIHRKRFINKISKLKMIIKLGIAGVKMSICRSDFYSMFDHMFDQIEKATLRVAVNG